MSGRRLPGRAIAERDVALWCNEGAGDAPDPGDLVRRLRAGGRSVRRIGKKGVARADPTTEVVLLAGGDGTVAKAVRRMSLGGVPLAILPSGTADNVARSLGLGACRDPLDALAGEARSVDLGVAHGPWGSRTFAESLGIGALAVAARRTHEAAKRIGGYGPFGKIRAGRRMIAAALAEPVPFDAELRDPQMAALGPAPPAFVEICNVARTGPAIEMAPGADPSDGLFNIVPGGAEGAAALRRACLEGGETATPRPPLPAIRLRRVEVSCRMRDLRIDGTFGPELTGGDPCDERRHDITVETVPGALWLVMPAGRAGRAP